MRAQATSCNINMLLILTPRSDPRSRIRRRRCHCTGQHFSSQASHSPANAHRQREVVSIAMPLHNAEVVRGPCISNTHGHHRAHHSPYHMEPLTLTPAHQPHPPHTDTASSLSVSFSKPLQQTAITAQSWLFSAASHLRCTNPDQLPSHCLIIAS